MATDVTEGFPWVCATGSCATPVVVVNNVGWGGLYDVRVLLSFLDTYYIVFLFLHIKSYVPYCSVKPPHKELFPLL